MTPAKCPNCPFLFDPSQVPPGAVIACPQCGTRFTLGTAAHPPRNAGLGVAPGPDVADTAADPTPTGRPTRHHRRSGGFGGTILALGGFALLVVVAVGVVVLTMVSRRTRTPGPVAPRDEIRKADLNFAFRKPAEPWVQDRATLNTLGVNVFAYKRAEPDGWIALSVRDYATQEPRPSELKEKVLSQLSNAFDHLPPDLAPEPVDWAGQKAERYPFRAVYRPTGEACVGDCYVLGFKGVGYWLYSWCPESAATGLAEELAGLRDGFRTLDQRDHWKPPAVAERVYRGKSGRYRLTDFERIWAEPKRKSPPDEDPKAELLLEGTLEIRERGDAKPRADLVVMILDGGDPAAGRRYVEDRYKQRYGDAGTEFKFEELTGEPEGDPPTNPEMPEAPVVRLKLTVGGEDAFRSADKLVVLSAIESDGKTVVAEATCPWKERAAWERRLVQLVGSLR